MPKITSGGPSNAWASPGEPGYVVPPAAQKPVDVPEPEPAAPAESEPAAAPPAASAVSESPVGLYDPAWPDRPPEVLVPQVTVVRPAGPEE